MVEMDGWGKDSKKSICGRRMIVAKKVACVLMQVVAYADCVIR